MTPAQLRMARALLQLGIRELAEKAGVDKMSVQRIESGRRAHPPTMGKIKATLIEEGIVFLGPVEPLHTETVALRWDRRETAADEEGRGDDRPDEHQSDGETRSWDSADADLSSERCAALQQYWSDVGRWRQLSTASQEALNKRIEDVRN